MGKMMSGKFNKIVIDLGDRFLFRVLPASALICRRPFGLAATREEAEAEADNYIQDAMREN